MRKHLVGVYKLGFRPIRLFVEPQSGNGSVTLVPDDDGSTVVTIGIDCSWCEAVSILLHEAYEAVLIDLNTRYQPAPAYSGESSDFMFITTHNQLSEAHERVGNFLIEAFPEFGKAYRKYSLYKD